MHTYASADEPALKATLAVEVLPVTPVEPEEGPMDERTLEGMLVASDTDAYWTVPSRIAQFDAMAYRMQTWKQPLGVEDRPGHTMLCGVERAKPPMPITDDACPTISIVSFLQKKHGWIPVQNAVTHTDLVHKEYDAREKVRMKKYYVVLAYLPKCLELTSSIPSQQPVNFYKCLLAGLHVEPHQGDRHYYLALNNHLKAKGKPLLPLPAEESTPAALLAPDDDDGIIVPQAYQDPAPKRRTGPGGRDRSPGRAEAKAKPKALPPAVPPGLRITRGSGSSGDPPPIVEPPPPIAAPTPPDDDDDGIIVPQGPPPPPPEVPAKRRKRANARDEFQPGIGDALVLYDPYTTPQGKFAPNWILLCPRHADCQKSRGVTESHCSRWGPIEPLAFLHEWIDVPDVPGKTHASLWPQAARVGAFAEAHREELKEIVVRAGLDVD